MAGGYLRRQGRTGPLYRPTSKRPAKAIGAKVVLRPEPIYSLAEADAWIAEAKQAQTDGLFLVVHDRQKHAWPTAAKAADSGLPTVILPLWVRPLRPILSPWPSSPAA